VISGCAELSTWPTSLRPSTGVEPMTVFTVSATVHVTFGTLAGIRPTTSRSKSSMISLRRVSHCALVATLAPLSSVMSSGSFG